MPIYCRVQELIHFLCHVFFVHGIVSEGASHVAVQPWTTVTIVSAQLYTIVDGWHHLVYAQLTCHTALYIMSNPIDSNYSLKQ